jgi:hypothetical protein
MDRYQRRVRVGAFGVITSLFAACGGGEPPRTMPGQEAAAPEADAILVTGVGLATPESVLHDRTADVYLVSNINGAPVDKDDNGFISRVSPHGDVLELKWIDGAAEDVTLNAPKGMAIQGGMLYVADIDCIRWFDRATGAPAGDVCVDGATFLNDVTPAPGGDVLFTDSGLDAAFGPTGADAVYRLHEGEVTPVTAGVDLGAPNGVVMAGDDIVVVTFMSGEIFRVGADGTRTDIAGPSELQLDGVVALPDGRLLASSWGSSCVYAVSEDGSMECLVEGVDAPADIGYDETRNRVLIPLFNANEVRIEPIG